MAEPGRVFVLRLEHGDVVHETIERFFRENGIRAASLTALGGADRGSILVVGPEQADARPIVTKEQVLEGVYEVTGTGTVFPNEKGDPVLHMHMACGRGGSSLTGCIRQGVRVWQYMEIVIHELVSSTGVRKKDGETGFELLVP